MWSYTMFLIHLRDLLCTERTHLARVGIRMEGLVADDQSLQPLQFTDLLEDLQPATLKPGLQCQRQHGRKQLYIPENWTRANSKFVIRTSNEQSL